MSEIIHVIDSGKIGRFSRLEFVVLRLDLVDIVGQDFGLLSEVTRQDQAEHSSELCQGQVSALNLA